MPLSNSSACGFIAHPQVQQQQRLILTVASTSNVENSGSDSSLIRSINDAVETTDSAPNRSSSSPPLPSQHLQQRHEQLPTCRICAVCQQSKERALFPRKEYAIFQDNQQPTCTHCRKTMQANRIRVPPPKPILRGRKAESGITRKPNNFGYCNYLDKLFALDCFPDIVKCGAFTTAKDVSESMAALQAATFHGKITRTQNEQENVLCLSIGDGSTPRSAVLVAFLKKGWRSISIDPALKPEWEGNHASIRGLYGFCGTVEEFVAAAATTTIPPGDYPPPDHIVLLCVHSHARFVGSASVANIRALYGGSGGADGVVPMAIVSLPCCAKFRHVGDIGRPPDVQYDDDCVFSACRTVEVWNFQGEGGK
ncbi:hypothetical protein MHU86_11608 [Fragilaria crotonensis]|nr:hypothetical protein MHU86_11608 [Fragilaria crotonensis]